MAVQKHEKEVFVYADWKRLKEPLPIGVLYSELLRGREIFSFEYHKSWLDSEFAQLIDPALQLYSGRHYLDTSKDNFGIFKDSSPDRWGRILMRRREAAIAKRENRNVNKLFETDYLLGVQDEYRMGGLRFKTDPDGPFLNNEETHNTSIRELEQISLQLEEDEVIDDPKYLEWLELLISPGSSIGGARPKANVRDKSNDLWIAKFPSKNDKEDKGGWEYVTHQLAGKAGIHMAEANARKFTSHNHTFLSKRFDRTLDGKRIHFASAMTMLDYTDGIDYKNGASYLEIVEFLIRHGSNVNKDLEQLWRRIVFNICVSNVDDHLRNHGFILTNDGWALSPAYDLNPDETGKGLNLNISSVNNALDLNVAMDVHQYFRLKESRAIEIISEVKSAVSTWRTIATKMGISRQEQELKEAAFQLE